MPLPTTDKLAVLIDADNAQSSIIVDLLTEVARYGTATIKRAYGDWTTPHLNGWREALNSHAIQPIQQFRYTTGKNVTDSALIIDAMDLLHGGRVDAFCLVSSDSDFTRLATRIREAGLAVYGFGEKKTPSSFVAACDKFIYTEVLRPSVAKRAAAKAPKDPLKPLLTAAIAGAAQKDGWAPLSNVGSLVLKSNPSFTARKHGYANLGDLVSRQAYLKVKKVSANGSPNAQIYVRIKET